MLSERIKKARNNAKLSQEELAKKLKVGKRTLVDYERGSSEPKVSTLLKIADFCNVNPNWLLTGEGEMTSKQDISNSNINNIKNSSNIAIGENITITTHSKEVSDLEDKLLESYRSLPKELQELYFHKIKAEAIEYKIRKQNESNQYKNK